MTSAVRHPVQMRDSYGGVLGRHQPSEPKLHRFGVNIKVKDESKRDRRIGLQEEQALRAACSEMNGAELKFVGSRMQDRIIGALETCCRQGEMVRIQNRHVD